MKKKKTVCGRCGGTLDTKDDPDFCEPCEVKIISEDAKIRKSVKKALEEINSGIYWTLKRKGKKFWFIPSPKLRKKGAKPHKL